MKDLTLLFKKRQLLLAQAHAHGKRCEKLMEEVAEIDKEIEQIKKDRGIEKE